MTERVIEILDREKGQLEYVLECMKEVGDSDLEHALECMETIKEIDKAIVLLENTNETIHR